MINFLRVIIVTLLIFFIPLISKAQSPPDPPPDVPIDGGVSLLIAAGVAYGGKKIAENRKAKKVLKSED